jgi:hypothetical protein
MRFKEASCSSLISVHVASQQASASPPIRFTLWHHACPCKTEQASSNHFDRREQDTSSNNAIKKLNDHKTSKQGKLKAPRSISLPLMLSRQQNLLNSHSLISGTYHTCSHRPALYQRHWVIIAFLIVNSKH